MIGSKRKSFAALKVNQRRLFWMKLSSLSPLVNAHMNERCCADAHATARGRGPEPLVVGSDSGGSFPSSWSGPRVPSCCPAWQMWEDLEPDTACRSSLSRNHGWPRVWQWFLWHTRSRPGPSWWQFRACQASEWVLLASPGCCIKKEKCWINAGYWKNKIHGHGTHKTKHIGYWILEKTMQLDRNYVI